ncbi:hypothetical protein GTO91_05790 [Heliobacterium undosum]|uniref:Abasic site processing protein n=2 Tax=Heliomicrobium undosum TaxID=121734 RepID=A0A845L0U8_9FIRM|nr:hypothetical protein [Heliomicrobium undosum]
MCGRFTLTVNPAELLEILGVPTAQEFAPRFNIAPGQNILTVVNQDGNKSMNARWGLIPHWAKDPAVGYKMINARAETLAEKPAFRSLLQSNRCLIPADGFYEWQRVGKQKIPHRFVLRDRGVFAFAGLCSTWRGPSGEVVNSCTIITTEPNELVASVHDRMPVIFYPEQCLIWMNSKVPMGEVLRPFPADRMEAHPVSPAVNSLKEEWSKTPSPIVQGTLF